MRNLVSIDTNVNQMSNGAGRSLRNSIGLSVYLGLSILLTTATPLSANASSGPFCFSIVREDGEVETAAETPELWRQLASAVYKDYTTHRPKILTTSFLGFDIEKSSPEGLFEFTRELTSITEAGGTRPKITQTGSHDGPGNGLRRRAGSYDFSTDEYNPAKGLPVALAEALASAPNYAKLSEATIENLLHLAERNPSVFYNSGVGNLVKLTQVHPELIARKGFRLIETALKIHDYGSAARLVSAIWRLSPNSTMFLGKEALEDLKAKALVEYMAVLSLEFSNPALPNDVPREAAAGWRYQFEFQKRRFTIHSDNPYDLISLRP